MEPPVWVDLEQLKKLISPLRILLLKLLLHLLHRNISAVANAVLKGTANGKSGTGDGLRIIEGPKGALPVSSKRDCPRGPTTSHESPIIVQCRVIECRAAEGNHLVFLVHVPAIEHIQQRTLPRTIGA